MSNDVTHLVRVLKEQYGVLFNAVIDRVIYNIKEGRGEIDAYEQAKTALDEIRDEYREASEQVKRTLYLVKEEEAIGNQTISTTQD